MSTAALMALTLMLHLAHRLLAPLMLRMLTLILRNSRTIILFPPIDYGCHSARLPCQHTWRAKGFVCAGMGFSGRQRGSETVPYFLSDLATGQADVPYQELEETDGNTPANLLLRDGGHLSRC